MGCRGALVRGIPPREDPPVEPDLGDPGEIVRERELTPEELDEIRRWLKRVGFQRPLDYRETFLARRILPRMRRLGYDDVTAYLKSLGRSEEDREKQLGRFIIPTTEFLRNPEVFDSIALNVSKRARESGWNSPRILSAACSTGEEPYSLAMRLMPLAAPWKIFALDRSVESLSRCRAGLFTERAVSKLDKQLKERYFKRVQGGWQASEVLRCRVFPFCWDLGCGVPPGRYHVILLRNVFIYLTESAQRRLLTEASGTLVDRGLLVLGKPESPGDVAEVGLSVVDRTSRIYERKEGVP